MYKNQMYKIYIFDLDDTLYLRSVFLDEYYLKEYTKKLKKLFDNLKEKGIILAMASHNIHALYYLKKIKLEKYFDYIISEYPRKKSDMIFEIIKNYNVDIKDVVFFDDLIDNIYDCDLNNIKAIFVDYKKGLDFDDSVFKL